MKRIDEDTVAVTNDEIENLRSFIWNKLYNEWDQYTNNIICSDTTEGAMHRMDPEMYDFMNKLDSI